ncbi:M3 family metallopeptidase [Riemerella anatipestifer]|uniref:M3 family metallopeptidase n=1 Tax=Riemerella anatipestifer TaxID=34085 RepID=UPI00129DE29C|nr:M3 family metallopeptidase [Riemerella anatipestifer]MBT0552096.1 M3 family metallopeptidase [Riemerella anatipestifer]MBT0554317.1 M3 family metallopeptidase [Riemerella anatipestifer]MCE3024840.1 M3 family metallopeptidase [Riemerella anatipestifer]MCU7543067.1 M3 family metallopeptidase [Riemerella anatipestifer]MCU7560573.1 M3 family metallopeptidase [Riemerella anatipestifer]
MNLLLKEFSTNYQSIPFDSIKEADFLPAFIELIKSIEEEIKNITENSESPTFENTIEAMSYSGKQLDVVSNLFFNLNSAETNDELQKIAQEVSPLLTEFSSKIFQNQNLFLRVKSVYDSKQNLDLNEEQTMLLEQTYKGFVRNGALLSEVDKKKLEGINKDLAIKSLTFGQNVLATTNTYFKHITDVNKLKGIPNDILNQYQEEAKSRGLEGYVITLQYPSYLPLMTYAEDRALRKELAVANGKKAFDEGEFDNQKLIEEIVLLRQKKASLLGYENYATYVLEERMAKSSVEVFSFLNELLEKARPYALKEIEELKTLAEKDGITDIQSYDHAFYAEKLRKQKFDLSDEELKPYFQLDKVEQSVFDLSKKIFGLEFEEITDISKYHPEVKTYKVTEQGEYKALLYVDYHPRKGKRAGAWMTSYRNQYKEEGINHRPHISVVCNFTKPTADTPSLLTFQEVTTLFHEFGHALHGILANTQYPNLSGTSVKWDFVELPSQFLENYCYEAEFLKTFAKHYKTGEILSNEKIEKIAQSKNFMEGYQTLRQLGFGLLDMHYHTTHFSDEEKLKIKDFEDKVMAVTQLYPIHSETAVSPSFSHIFQGGYAAGYYSYKWAEVLDADAFQYFKENGIFNQEIAEKYKQLLSSGGTIDPMVLYKNFRGREPKVESLLTRAFG